MECDMAGGKLVQWLKRINVVLFCVVLVACGGGSSGEAIGTDDTIEVPRETTETIGDNKYTTIQRQANLGELRYSSISAEEFITQYFLLAGQVSSTQFMLSEPQTFVIPENTVSFSLNFNNPLAGNDVFVGELENPSGVKISLWDLIPCFSGTCSMVMPNRPNALYQPEAGEWKYSVLAEKSAVEHGHLNNASINMLIRTNDFPQGQGGLDATLRVQPYYTGGTTSLDAVSSIMNSLATIFLINNIGLDWLPAKHIVPNAFSTMIPDYSDVKTQVLMAYGEANVINVYFVEGFEEEQEGAGALVHPGMSEEVRAIIGIAAGIPGSLGTKGDANGVMVALGVGHEGQFEARSYLEVAETAAHEIGHFLGLFHTTERSGGVDPLPDTPNCNEERPDDGALPSADECPDGHNLMFPIAREDGELGITLTADQRFVLANSPMAQ